MDFLAGQENVTCNELHGLFEQFFVLVETVVRLPPGLERRAAFREISDYGTRIDAIAAKWVKSDHR